MHRAEAQEAIITKTMDQADKLIATTYKKITRGKSFWERSPLDDAFEAMDKLYICHIYQQEQQYWESDVSLGKTIVNKMRNLQSIAFDRYSKTLSCNVGMLLKIKKATLLVDTAKAALDESDRHIYDDMPPLRAILPPPYTTL